MKTKIFDSKKGGFTEDGVVVDKLFTGSHKPTQLGYTLSRLKDETYTLQEAYTVILRMIVEGKTDL